MNQKYIKKRLYAIPALLFCVSLQGTETTEQNTAQPNTTQINTTQINTEIYSNDNLANQQDLATSDLDQMRRPWPHHAKPSSQHKPNNTASHNMSEWQNSAGQYNTNYASQQNNVGAYNTSYNATPYDMAGSYNNMPEWQNNAESYNTDYVAQQNNAGFLDASFGPNAQGYAITEMGGSSAVRAVITQANNKIVVTGVRDGYPVLAQYNDNGSLDQNFGSGNYGPGRTQGITIQTSLGKGSFFNAIAIQKDQKIVAAGGAAGNGILARYWNDGIIDTTFGDKGIIRTNLPGELTAVAIQTDGKIVVAGYNNYTASNTQFVLMRFNINGTPDTDFGTAGIVLSRLGGTTSSRINGITIEKGNNKIIVVGTANTFLAMARYNEDGSLDSSFGIDGTGTRILFTPGNFYDVKVQNDGKIVLVATITSPNKSQFTVIRLDENGQQFDPSFGTIGGTNGVVNVSPRDINDNSYVRSVVIDGNGSIIVMGYTIVRVGSTNNNYFSLVRLNHNGRLDEAFGNLGRMNNQLTIGSNRNQTTLPVFGAIQNDGRKLILAGNYYFHRVDSSPREAASGHRFAVARYSNINN